MTGFRSRIKDAWCLIVHDQPMWPIHGYSRCRVCFRRRPVPWETPARDSTGFGAARTGLTTNIDSLKSLDSTRHIKAA